MAANRRRTERSESAAERARKAPPTAAPAAPPLSAPGVHPVVPFFVHRFCAPAGAFFLKGRHKFALLNDTIALRLKNRVVPLLLLAVFLTNGAAKTAHPLAPLRGGKSPRAALRFCGRLLEKNKRGKTPRPNSWTEASAPAAPRRRTGRSESAAHAKERRKPALLLLTSRLAIVYNYKRAVYNLICLWR